LTGAPGLEGPLRHSTPWSEFIKREMEQSGATSLQQELNFLDRQSFQIFRQSASIPLRPGERQNGPVG
jgi:hypothetical protein